MSPLRVNLKDSTLANAVSSGTLPIYANYSPKIDGIVSEKEWSIASRIRIHDGVILVQNDAVNLYLLIDLKATLTTILN